MIRSCFGREEASAPASAGIGGMAAPVPATDGSMLRDSAACREGRMERLVYNGDVEGEHSAAMDYLPPEQLATLWARVRGRLQQEVGEVEYRTWLRQMTLVGLDGDEITVHLPTRFLRDWVRAQFGDRLTTLWQEQLPAVRRVEVGVGNGGGTGLAESVSPPPRSPTGPLRPLEAKSLIQGGVQGVEEAHVEEDVRVGVCEQGRVRACGLDQQDERGKQRGTVRVGRGRVDDGQVQVECLRGHRLGEEDADAR